MKGLRILALVLCAAVALLATCTLVRAQPAKPAHGDATAGAALHAKDCVSCHVRRVGGDGTLMYTRTDRKVTTPQKLQAQVAFCNAELSTGYFPDEETDVAAFLNQSYYKFPR